jgi:hypothetical protein
MGVYSFSNSILMLEWLMETKLRKTCDMWPIELGGWGGIIWMIDRSKVAKKTCVCLEYVCENQEKNMCGSLFLGEANSHMCPWICFLFNWLEMLFIIRSFESKWVGNVYIFCWNESKVQEVFSFWKQRAWKKFYACTFCEEKIVSFEHMTILKISQNLAWDIAKESLNTRQLYINNFNTFDKTLIWT